MSLNEYLAVLNCSPSNFQNLGVADLVEFTSELREGQRCIVRAKVVFVDGSIFYLKEFISARYGSDRLSYSYHYQAENGFLNFRYDNAEHKPKLDFQEHKHLADFSIIQHPAPSIESLINEILSYFDDDNSGTN